MQKGRLIGPALLVKMDRLGCLEGAIDALVPDPHPSAGGYPGVQKE
jgi:hypothetical protein